MNCPSCDSADISVTDTRTRARVNCVCRRRKCLSCGTKFSTVEKVTKHSEWLGVAELALDELSVIEMVDLQEMVSLRLKNSWITTRKEKELSK